MKNIFKSPYMILKLCALMFKFISIFSLYFGFMGAFTYEGKSAGVRLLIFLAGLGLFLVLFTFGEIIKVIVNDFLLPKKAALGKMLPRN